MRCLLRACLFVLAGLSASGCATGLLYSDTVYPVVYHMEETPRGQKMVELSSYFVRVPLVRFISPTAEVRSRAIGDAAAKGGLHEVRYADLRTISILGGLWKRQTIRVYGE